MCAVVDFNPGWITNQSLAIISEMMPVVSGKFGSIRLSSEDVKEPSALVQKGRGSSSVPSVGNEIKLSKFHTQLLDKL